MSASTLSVTPEVTAALANLKTAFFAAVASVPSLPTSLLTGAVKLDVFEESVSITISMSPELKADLAEITRKFNAFAATK